MLKRNNAFKDGKAIKVKKISEADNDRLRSVINYLVNNHGLQSLQPYFTDDLDVVDTKLEYTSRKKSGYAYVYTRRYDKIVWVEKKLGIDRLKPAEEFADNSFYFTTNTAIIPVKGYDYVIDLYSSGADDTLHYSFDNLKTTIVKNNGGNSSITINNQRATFNTGAIAAGCLRKLKLPAYKKYITQSDTETEIALPADSLSFTKNTGGYSITLLINRLRVSKTSLPDSVNISYLYGYYLIKQNAR